jgi:pyrroloquinoline quinone biosynthesis protein E
MIANPDVLEIGAMENGFTDVWHGQAFGDFRRAHQEGKIPAACRNCYKADA